jgi:hypothetical protein
MTDNIVLKLTQAMKAVGDIKKRGKYEQGKTSYNFMQADDISQAVQSALIEAGLIIIPGIDGFKQEEVESQYGTKGYHTLINMQFTISDGVDNFVTPWASESIDYSDKGMSKAATLGRKYFLISLFHIATGDSKDDSDGENHDLKSRSGTATPKQEQQASPKSISEPKQEPLPKGEPTDDKRPLDPVALMKKLVITQEKVPPASEKQVKLVARMLTEHCENEQDSDQLKEWLFGVPSTKEADPQMVNAVLKWLNIGEDWQVGKYVQSEINNVLAFLKG